LIQKNLNKLDLISHSLGMSCIERSSRNLYNAQNPSSICLSTDSTIDINIKGTTALIFMKLSTKIMSLEMLQSWYFSVLSHQ